MWWKDAQDERLLAVPLGFIAERRDTRCEAVCATCEAHQPVYFASLLKSHGPTATLGAARGAMPCIFCGEKGTLRVRFVPR